MAIFSRSFIRKRAIAAATTLLVSVVSLSLSQAPNTVHRHSPPVAAQPASGWQQVSNEASALQANGHGAGPAQPCKWRVRAVQTTVTSAPLPPLG
jgi:hypothetical protein